MAKPPDPPTPLSDAEMRETPALKRRLRALGAELRRFRLAHEFSLNTAADRTGLDVKYIQKVERGEKNMTIATLMRFARGYGLDLTVAFVSQVPPPSRSRAVRPRHRRPSARSRNG